MGAGVCSIMFDSIGTYIYMLYVRQNVCILNVTNIPMIHRNCDFLRKALYFTYILHILDEHSLQKCMTKVGCKCSGYYTVSQKAVIGTYGPVFDISRYIYLPLSCNLKQNNYIVYRL